jgi:phage tail sheath protein FI
MYINAERLFQFVEKALNASSQWVAFENNTDVTRLRLSSQINGFLLSLFNQGYFAGATPQTSFFVVCDGSNNPPESVSAGYLYADIGIAPSKPAEFVVLRFRQMTLS